MNNNQNYRGLEERLIELQRQNQKLVEELSTSLIQNNNEAILIFQGERVAFINTKAIALLGQDLSGLTDNAFVKCFHRNDKQKIRKFVAADESVSLLNNSFLLYGVDGKNRWIEISPKKIEWKGSPAVMIFLDDVSRVREIELKLHETQNQLLVSNARLNELIKNSPAVIFSIAPFQNFPIRYISGNVKNILGYEPSEFLADEKLWFSRIAIKDRKEVREKIKDAFRSGESNCGYQFMRKDGVLVYLLDHYSVEYDKDGVAIELVGCSIDISRQKDIYQGLVASEELYRTTIDSLHLYGIHVIDRNHRILAVNLPLRKVWEEHGVKDEIKGSHICKLFPQMRETIEKEYRHIFETGEKQVGQFERQLNNVNHCFYFERIPVVQDGEVSRVVTIIEDISDDALVQKRLKQRFDFNQLLTRLAINITGKKSENILAEVNEIVKSLGEFSHFERCFLLFSSNTKEYVCTNEWFAESAKTYSKLGKTILVSEMEWVFSRLEKNETAYMPDYENTRFIKEEQRKYFIENNVRSVLVMPIDVDGKLVGCLGFENYSVVRYWKGDILALMRKLTLLLGNIYESILAVDCLKEK